MGFYFCSTLGKNISKSYQQVNEKIKNEKKRQKVDTGRC
jgi:DNA-directed RNA polymerase subunit N (RpoN/RPB10)